MIELVDNLGNSIGVFENEIIKNAHKQNGFIEVPLCTNFFIKKRWDFQNQIWIEGATPEEIAEQELEQQKLLKQQQYEELLPTDWYVVRFIETGIPVPEEILQQRQAIREKCK